MELDIAISLIPFLNVREKFILRNNLDSLDALAVVSIKDISILINRVVNTHDWDGRKLAQTALRSAQIMASNSIKCCLFGQPDYPELLKEIPDYPYMIFYRGDLSILKKESVSIVGTRQICSEAALFTRDFSRQAAEAGICVVSGLAYGVDTFAHRAAVESGVQGATCAVLPGGIDSVVPSGNKRLAAKILENSGLLMSEYAPGRPVEKWCFVRRNRIIAGLSNTTLVAQAHAGSGAMITADFAVDYNRDIMFSKACFCSEAKNIAKKTLLLNSKNIKKNSPESYVEEGAPVISDFSEYRNISDGGFHYHAKKDFGQLDLF